MAETGGRIARVTQSLREFAAVMSQPGLARAVAAYATFNFGEWATWIAVLVYAYERGGATESGVVAFLMLVPAAIVAPFAAGVGDRFRRERALLASYVVQAVVMAAAAAALLADAPSPVVYLFAAATSTGVTLTRPAHGAILPALSLTPAILTSANVASGTAQNVSIMIAPAAAGLILNGYGAGAVFAVSAVGLAIGALVVAGIRTEPTSLGAEAEPHGTSLGDLAAGLSTLLRLPGPRTIVALIGAAAVVEGALDVLIIVLAFDLVGIGEAGVGFLSSAAGLGGVIGAAAAMTLVGRARLAGPFAFGLLLWGLPVGIVGLLPTLAIALALLIAAGAGRGLLDVAGRTLLQRVTPDHSMGQAFGAIEAAYMSMIAVGSIVVPAIIALAGPRQALILVGLWLPIIVALMWRTLRRVDAAAVVHVREIELLRGNPVFASMAPPTIERLSANLVHVMVPAGAWVMRQGDGGDRFFIVDRGETEVFVDDRLVRREGPGDSFGEIALIRDVPRTASVRAATNLELFALDREIFLAAVAGHPGSRAAAEARATERLATR